MGCDLTPEEMRSTLRANAIELLALLSDPAQQLGYERNVRFVSIPRELVCQWFDDFYSHAEGEAF